MAALTILTNTFSGVDNSNQSGKLHPKMPTTAPRTILGDVKNVRGQKSVAFNEPVKPVATGTSVKHQLSAKKNQSSSYKIHTDKASSISKKSISTPFKIFTDKPSVLSSKLEHRSVSEIDVPTEKEYMKPFVDSDLIFPAPEYLTRVLTHKPYYSVDVFGTFRDDPYDVEPQLFAEPLSDPETPALGSLADDVGREDLPSQFAVITDEDLAEMERMIPLEPLDAKW